MDQELRRWLLFLRENRVLVKYPRKRGRFAIVGENHRSVSLIRLTAGSTEQVELTFDEIEDLHARILKTKGGVPLDDLMGRPALVAVAGSLVDIYYSPVSRALLPIPDEKAARIALLELVSNWNRFVPEYKPLLLLSVLAAMDTGLIPDNRIKYDVISQQFAVQASKRGIPKTAENAAMPFYRLTTDLFWMISIRDLSSLPTDRFGYAISRIDHAFIREPFWGLLQDPAFRLELENRLNAMLPMKAEISGNARLFIEKTLVKGRPDREHGPHALGRALWSPQASEKGARIYELMTELKRGDIVFHLIDNREISGYSTVESLVDRNFVGLSGTQWANRPGYRVSLGDFTRLEPPLERDWLLKDERHRSTLLHLLQQGSRVFYNKSLELNQGAYLTEIPQQLLNILKDVYQSHAGKAIPLDSTAPSPPDIKDFLARFEHTAAEAGLVLDSTVLHRIAASLLAKRLLILTGLSGSGKTKLAQAFAKYLLPPDSRSLRVVPVGADWMSNENVLGYPDGLDPKNYLIQPALELVLFAAQNPSMPCFLILDEMNLSHVERYFADFLSAMESEEAIPLYSGTQREGSGQVIPHELPIPSNLFVIGTVNVDETTYMFSPKVLDRAGVIEFRVTSRDIQNLLQQNQVPDLSIISGKGQSFAATFVNAAQNQSVRLPDTIRNTFTREIRTFFEIFQTHRTEFGFRVVHEAAHFINAYKILGGYDDGADDWFPEAFDAVIVQKFLPKLHGSRVRLEGLLWALYWACAVQRGNEEEFRHDYLAAGRAEDDGKYSPDSVNAAISKKLYPLSAEKVFRMWRRLTQDQFVSFAEA